MLSWNGPKMDKRKQRQRKSCVVIEESPSSEILLNKAEVWIRLSSANKLATVENLTDWRQWRFPNLDNMIYEETFPHVQTWFALGRYKRLITEDIRERELGKLNEFVSSSSQYWHEWATWKNQYSVQQREKIYQFSDCDGTRLSRKRRNHKKFSFYIQFLF